jgi:hypothetical protein
MCTEENRSNLLCGICIISFLVGLGVTLIILGETLDIIDLVILGCIFLIFGTFVSTCIIVMIVRPLYNSRKIGYSTEDLRDVHLLRKQSAFSQHQGSIYIRDMYAGSDDRQTLSSVLVEVKSRPVTTESKRSDMFLVKNSRPSSICSSNSSFVTALDHNRDSLISENERVKSSDEEKIERNTPTEKSKLKVVFDEKNNHVTKF